MANINYLKEFKVHQVLLFIICGILVVLFLNYNNLILYSKPKTTSSNNVLYENVNHSVIETFNSGEPFTDSLNDDKYYLYMEILEIQDTNQISLQMNGLTFYNNDNKIDGTQLKVEHVTSNSVHNNNYLNHLIDGKNNTTYLEIINKSNSIKKIIKFIIPKTIVIDNYTITKSNNNDGTPKKWNMYYSITNYKTKSEYSNGSDKIIVSTVEDGGNLQQISDGIESNKFILNNKVPITTVPAIFNEFELNSITTNIYNVLRLLSPTETTNGSTPSHKIATYNKLRITSFDIVNNLNNRLYEGIYNVTENMLSVTKNDIKKDMENVFISKELDIRNDKQMNYSSDTRIPIPFKFEYGVKLDIDFILQFSYNLNPLKVPSKITITEMPSSEFLIKSERDKYNTYTLDSFSLDIEPNNPNVVIFKFNLPDFKHDTHTLNQVLNLKLHFNTTNIGAETNYTTLMSKLNVFTSTLQYNILRDNNIVFSVDMRFIHDRNEMNGSLKDYTEKEIENIFTETLNDKYNKIITPLFVLDNDLSKHEKEINDIRKHYLLDELSSVKNNVKFFNTYK